MPFYERQPYIQPLYQLVAEVTGGEVRVPHFQRPGSEWLPEQRGDLLDSVYRGFPIGMILLWSTRIQVGTYPKVGPFEIPPIPQGELRVQRLLLDGHQRLSTLVRILGRGLAREMDRPEPPVEEDEERWVFEVDQPDDGRRTRERFILLKNGDQPSPTQVELAMALNRLSLNEWIRRHPSLTAEQIRLADGLRDRLREYTIPVAVLVAEGLDEATESFKRINSSGTPMSPFHMVSARAYRPQFDLQKLFEQQMEEHLSPVGWGALDETDLLRICVGLDPKANPLKLNVEDAADRLRSDKELVPKALDGARLAANLLRTCGVHGPNALPYSYQFVTLATLLARRPALAAKNREQDAMRRWFWLTTYGEVFGGVNSAIFERAYSALETMVAGGDFSGMTRDLTRSVEEPKRFDYRAARSKACALAMARVQDRNKVDGPAHRALAASGVGALESLNANRSNWWSRVIVTPSAGLADLRQAFRQVAGGSRVPEDLELLEFLGFPSQPKGDADELLLARRACLAQLEREFVESLGLQWRT